MNKSYQYHVQMFLVVLDAGATEGNYLSRLKI